MEGIDYSDIPKLSRALTRAAETTPERVRKTVVKFANAIQGDAKIKAPVHTGNLRDSIGYDIADALATTEATIGPTANYGGYVEYGTSRMSPQPYLGPAFERNAPAFEAAMDILAGKGLT